jgi:hypothetical protein
MKRIAANGAKKMICFPLSTPIRSAVGAGSVITKALISLDYCGKTILNIGR